VTAPTISEARRLLADNGQGHVLRFWDDLGETQRAALLEQVAAIDFSLMNRLIEQWVLNEPVPEQFAAIEPVPLIPKIDLARADAREAYQAGEDALRAGRVGLLLVAGGQGTRLGFDGPKGAYRIGPVSKRSLFQFHAEKIHNLERRYACRLPWYIMVSGANEDATRAYFRDNDFFGLKPGDVAFLRQRMVPCVEPEGRFMLEGPGRLATNPNGHGGCIPAVVENGVIQNARDRGIDTLSYFQVDNWAVKVADPYFVGHHVLRNADMSSKNHLKADPREAVGVHCLCNGDYRVIEYTELDIYPQLLATDAAGHIVHSAGNPAIHILSVDFIEYVYEHYDQFPWHRARKRIACVDDQGHTIEPDEPNGYKFETFVFDALRFIRHQPVAVAIDRAGEYTPIKQFEGANSVVAAWQRMAEYWADWLTAAGAEIPRNADGQVAVEIEISPEFALTKAEFLSKASGREWPHDADIAIGPDGQLIEPVAGASDVSGS